MAQQTPQAAGSGQQQVAPAARDTRALLAANHLHTGNLEAGRDPLQSLIAARLEKAASREADAALINAHLFDLYLGGRRDPNDPLISALGTALMLLKCDAFNERKSAEQLQEPVGQRQGGAA